MRARVKSLLERFGRARPAPSDRVGFFDLWREAEWGEVWCAVVSCAVSVCGAGGLAAAVLAYGELTALFVARASGQDAPRAPLLALFGGGARPGAGASPAAHLDALLMDSVAFAAASAAIMAAQGAAAAAALALASRAADRMVRRLRLRLLRSLLARDLASFDGDRSPSFASVLTEDMERLRAGVGEQLVMTAQLAGGALGALALALLSGWRLALGGVAATALNALAAARVAARQSALSAAEAGAYGVAARVAEEAFAGVRTVRAYGAEAGEAARFAGALRPATRAARARGLVAAAGAGVGWLLTYGVNALVFAYGAELVARDLALPADEREYHPGVLVTVLFCTFAASQNVTLCGPHLELVAAARGAARSVFGALAAAPGSTARAAGARPALSGAFSFADVHFAYPSRPDAKVLRGLTLRVRAGETVALVGRSGGGKSTVLQLLQAAYAPDAGEIAVDGVPLRDVDARHFRSEIGVVGQEPVLFAGTVRENIALGAGDVSDDEIVEAARLAHAHDFVVRLPRGYETAVGAGGAALSGGQKQRLAIARALVRRPALLLLDEPTAALDAHSERAVQAALDAASAGRTTVVVSHRLHTLRAADRIVYMHEGVALESGSHDELIARRGAYWRLTLADSSAPEGRPAAAPDADPGPPSDDRAEPPPAEAREHEAENTTKPEVGDAAEDDDEGEASSWRLLRLHAPDWRLMALGGLASFLVGATMPAFAYLFSRLYGALGAAEAEALRAAARRGAAQFAAAAVLVAAAAAAHTWLFALAGARLTARLRVRLFEHYLRRDQTWFDAPRRSVGALCARLAADAAAVQAATGPRLGAVLQGASTGALGVALAAAYSWKMTLVSLAAVPLVVGAIAAEGAAGRRAERRGRRALEDASRLATEAVANVRTARALGAEDALVARYGAALAAAGEGGAARAARALAYGACQCAPTLGYAVSLAYGGYLVAREGLRYEHAILVSEALVYGAWMLAEALSFAPSFGAARRAGARILTTLAREPVDAAVAPDEPEWRSDGEVRFSGVEWAHRGGKVLRGVSAHAAAGRTLALVGRSGCGKSTLLQLALRAYEASAGTVSVGGRDVRSLAPAALRRQAALVEQEPVLFSRTIRENIAFGADASDADVVRAARDADAHSFVAALPLGYETPVRGATLSGGQKQRLCLARALLRRPPLLLLDEATSALDAHSERAVLEALARAARGRTTIVVAHRLATVRDADTICVLDDGVVAESGSHEELCARRGLYWRLLEQQASSG